VFFSSGLGENTSITKNTLLHHNPLFHQYYILIYLFGRRGNSATNLFKKKLQQIIQFPQQRITCCADCDHGNWNSSECSRAGACDKSIAAPFSVLSKLTDQPKIRMESFGASKEIKNDLQNRPAKQA
jgi:hypothetical protein